MQNILVIDDQPAIGDALSTLFDIHEVGRTLCAQSPQEGLELLHTRSVQLVIQDMNFSADTTSGEEGKKLFQSIRQQFPDLPIILLTGWAHLEMAVELVRAGAADYIAKPWDDPKLLTTVRNLLELGEQQQVNKNLSQERSQSRKDLAERYNLCGLVYQSEKIHQLLSIATKVAKSDISVLITGANGAGKEKIAEIIQANSSCNNGPFIKTNIGALPTDLIESELFGSEAGAYTSSNKVRAGRFEAADGGTLFLDEIGNLSLTGQAKLLRVLQTGEFERLGSSKTRKTKVRVISATNSDLQAAVKNGEFREDLYFRLNVIELEVPSLRERRDDILPLAYHFLGDDYSLSEAAESALYHYAFPGNVRELENCIQRARLLAASSEIQLEELALPTPIDVSETLSFDVDENTIRKALVESRGVIASAARGLGLSRQALYRRMEKYGIEK